MADETMDQGEGLGGPNDDGFVQGGRGQEDPVVGEFHARDGTRVSVQSFEVAVGLVGRHRSHAFR